MTKHPSRNVDPLDRGKRATGGSLADSIPKSRFSWRLDRIDWDGRWGWHQVTPDTMLREVVPKLHSFESMTWAEIDGVSGSHFVQCASIIRDARNRLVELGIDNDPLFSLRITGRRRVWGIRDVAILRLLWWDPEHEICPSLKG